MIRSALLIPLLVTGVIAVPASAHAVSILAKFVGHWSCTGNFSNGTPIAGELAMQLDETTGGLIVRHDDVAPGAYHALEVWTVNKGDTGVRAAISDKYSGMRWFESPGWVGNTLTWTRLESGIAAEQFAYEFKDATMQVQWSIAQGGAMKLGDTLTCRRT